MMQWFGSGRSGFRASGSHDDKSPNAENATEEAKKKKETDEETKEDPKAPEKKEE